MSGPGKPIIKAERNLLIKAKKLWVEFTYIIPTGHFPSESFICLCKCHFDIIFTESIKRGHYTRPPPCRDAPASEIKIFVVVGCCYCSSSDSQSTVSFWKERKNEKNRGVGGGEKERVGERERERTREPEIVAGFTNWHSLINSISWFSGTLSKGTCLCVHRLKLY